MIMLKELLRQDIFRSVEMVWRAIYFVVTRNMICNSAENALRQLMRPETLLHLKYLMRDRIRSLFVEDEMSNNVTTLRL